MIDSKAQTTRRDTRLKAKRDLSLLIAGKMIPFTKGAEQEIIARLNEQGNSKAASRSALYNAQKTIQYLDSLLTSECYFEIDGDRAESITEQQRNEARKQLISVSNNSKRTH